MRADTRVLSSTRAAWLVRGQASVLGAVLAAFALVGCQELNPGIVGDDTVERPDLVALLRECSDQLRDSGVILLEQERICFITPFAEDCPLRYCAQLLLGRIEQACPPPDSGLLPADPQFCEALANPLGGSLP